MNTVHRLFFAIRPDAAAAASAAALAQRLRAALGLVGKPLASERLHVTLHWMNDHAEWPRELVAAAKAAGGRVDRAPFDVVFDRVESFGRAGHGGPLVLTGGAALAALRRLREALGAALADAGIGADPRARFKPHMTLLYDPRHVAPQAVDAIRWRVDELVLIDSLVGQQTHLVIGRWPLRVRRQGFEGG